MDTLSSYKLAAKPKTCSLNKHVSNNQLLLLIVTSVITSVQTVSSQSRYAGQPVIAHNSSAEPIANHKVDANRDVIAWQSEWSESSVTDHDTVMKNGAHFANIRHSNSNTDSTDTLSLNNKPSRRQALELDAALESIDQDHYSWSLVSAISKIKKTHGPAPLPISWSDKSIASTRPDLTTKYRWLSDDASLRTSTDDPISPYHYSSGRFSEQFMSTKYETAAVFTTITAIGIINWNWGNSGFRFNNEGWFSEEKTGSGGVDKLGHAYTSYMITEFLHSAILRNSSDPQGAHFTAALTSLSLMTYIEVLDGYSGDHGFSYEDMVMNIAGAGFSVFRNSIPGMREKIAFRMQYLPSPLSSFEPFGDYSGQKYLLALKLGGFDMFRDTPMRYLELHSGYYARGFSKEERNAGYERERNFYVGIGVNLQELIFGKKSENDHQLRKAGRAALDYYQVPYSYISSDGNSGR